MRRALLLWAVTMVACSSPAAPRPATVDAGEETEPPPKPPVDPARFDCTSLSKGPPARRSSTPEACLRDPKCKTRLVCGHRGAGGDLGRIAPEDTLAAYRAAIVIGPDLVATDPPPTKDGVLVNVHDTTVDRTTNGTGDVEQLTFDEIRKLSVKTDLPGDFSCEKVPTLREILELSRGRALVLVDANKTSRVDLLVNAIRDADALDWAVFDTSSVDKIDQALAIEPRLMIMPRVADATAASAVLAKYEGHLPVFVEIDEKAFPKAVDVIHAAGTRAFTDVFLVDVGVKLGQPPSRYLEIFDKGADAVQSDLPDQVLAALGRNIAAE
ncbi:MAG: glycerophosphodiester phosphodiesterase family protein [Deltaproteobacteria bacterium]|nr:glycerophosphodiester phosphodiesterase family protein [Deltaproteobacteria bacterium]